MPLPVPPNSAPKKEPDELQVDNGLNKCPKCGSSEVQLNVATGKLVCLFCRFSWQRETAVEKLALGTPIEELVGDHITTGVGLMDESASASVTIECQGCGAEVVVNTEESVQARCHWCRQTLSINKQVPNGAVPDAVLPFRLTKNDAVERISEFAKKRKFYAHPKFIKEFVPDNVVGVYMPYLVIDGNLTGEVVGVGEIQTRTWTVTTGSGNSKRTTRYYDADVYRVARRFDYTVDDLQIESNSDRLSRGKNNTNNIINSILPFDTKNAVVYDSHYLAGFTSEKRDMDVESMKPIIRDQFLSIARSEASETIGPYLKRGVRWTEEGVNVRGTRWVAMYLPVWLYSYYQEDRDILHYIAVNGRTGETMGSIPVNRAKLAIASAMTGVVVEVGTIAGLLLGGS